MTITSRLRVDAGDFMIFVDAIGEVTESGTELIDLEVVEVDHQLHDVDAGFVDRFRKCLTELAREKIEQGDFEE